MTDKEGTQPCKALKHMLRRKVSHTCTRAQLMVGHRGEGTDITTSLLQESPCITKLHSCNGDKTVSIKPVCYIICSWLVFLKIYENFPETLAASEALSEHKTRKKDQANLPPSQAVQIITSQQVDCCNKNISSPSKYPMEKEPKKPQAPLNWCPEGYRFWH